MHFNSKELVWHDGKYVRFLSQEYTEKYFHEARKHLCSWENNCRYLIKVNTHRCSLYYFKRYCDSRMILAL